MLIESISSNRPYKKSFFSISIAEMRAKITTPKAPHSIPPRFQVRCGNPINYLSGFLHAGNSKDLITCKSWEFLYMGWVWLGFFYYHYYYYYFLGWCWVYFAWMFVIFLLFSARGSLCKE